MGKLSTRVFFTLLPSLLFTLPYTTDFEGVKDRALLKEMRDRSDLVQLKSRPPASLNGLKYRAAGDIPDLLKVLRAFGYYDAEITYKVAMNGEDRAHVTMRVYLGAQYKIGAYDIFSGGSEDKKLLACGGKLTPESLGVALGSPAFSPNIVNAELNILNKLSECGYPLASVEKRKVVVDMQTKKVDAFTSVNEGPLSKFGPVNILGLKKVKEAFILKRIDWQEGQTYSSLNTEETQKRLLNSNLFSSVMISHEEEVNEKGELPITLRVSESKHRQVSLGPFYATVDGPGGMFSWTHRNLRGMGESINLNGEFSKRYLTGIVTYKKPDFFRLDQTYRLIGQIEKLNIHAYNAFIYRGVNYFDKKIGPRKNISIGLQVQHLNVTDSANNGTYLFLDFPMIARYNNANDIMNPTRGFSIVYQPHFYKSLEKSVSFIKQRLTTCFYIPLIKKNLTFAARMQCGSIAGAKQDEVPLPILFLGGSEDDLRGYRYLTVSPLDHKNRPLGGRSAIFLTAETRLRMGDFGIVPFGDFGTVSFKEMPTVNEKWYKSVGVGLRYYTSFGPLRFDVGFPLDRRKKIDHAFRFYASIGQTF